MDYALEQTVRSQLASNEKLLWTGQPRRGLRLRATDALAIPFSLLWCGFAIFWEWSVLKQGAPGFFALWGIPFVAIGLYVVFGRFFVDALQRARTYYALTDQRALIISGLVNRQTKSLPLRTMTISRWLNAWMAVAPLLSRLRRGCMAGSAAPGGRGRAGINRRPSR